MARDIPTLLTDFDAFYQKLRQFRADNPNPRLASLAQEMSQLLSDLHEKLPDPNNADHVPLSNTTGDFESIAYQIKSKIAAKGTWKDFLTSSTGTTFIEYSSAIGVFCQYNIELAAREAFPTTALRDSSIYASARLLGVKIGRKIPGSIKLTVSNRGQSIVVLPSKSLFTVSGTIPFFSKTTLTLYPGTSQDIMVYSGKPKTATFTVPNTPFYEFIIPELGFTVSGDPADFAVFVTDSKGVQTAWASTDQPLWNHAYTDKVYYESTTGDGAVSIIFGDGVYGASPSPGDTVQVEYIQLTGREITGVLLGDTVAFPGNKDVGSRVIGIASEGQSEKPSIYYKMYAPHIFKARGRAINKTDYLAIILSHPEVASCTVHGQRDLYPNDPKWMNTVRICILPMDLDNWGGVNPNPQSIKWSQFLEWMKPKLPEALQIQTWNPTILTVEPIVKVALRQTAVYEDAYAQVSSNLTNLFRRNMYSLGKTVYLSDIEAACRTNDVDYVQIVSPTTDLVPLDAYTYIVSSNPIITMFYSERKSLPSYR